MELRPLVLAFLEIQPLYGYELVRRARERGKLDWEEGTLYPLLHKMEKEGLLSSKWEIAPNQKRRKYYALTRKGHGFLKRARSDWKKHMQVISNILFGGSDGIT